MKNITEYISEAKKNPVEAIKNCAIGLLDYFNQEGVIKWDEDRLKEYVKGKKEPDYKDLVDEMIYDLNKYKDKDNILPILQKYEENKVIINNAIMDAMTEYVKDIIDI